MLLQPLQVGQFDKEIGSKIRVSTRRDCRDRLIERLEAHTRTLSESHEAMGGQKLVAGERGRVEVADYHVVDEHGVIGGSITQIEASRSARASI